MKLFLKISLFVIILLGSFQTFRIIGRSSSIYPLPYIIKNSNYPDLEVAENCDILIIGDRMAQGLENLRVTILKDLNKDFSNLNIFNWAGENEGIQRTLDKLASMKKYPEIIIYQGASKEFYEEKFDLGQKPDFEKNLEKYYDEKTISTLMAFPFLSKFVYSYDNLVQLGPEPKRSFAEKPVETIQQTFEMGYKLFEIEMDKLVALASEKNFTLFILTSPINLNIAPKEICSNSISRTLEEEQGEISKLISEGQTKEAFDRLNILGDSVLGNAMNYYLLGMTLEKMGRFEDAALALNQGSAFDCFPWRSNIVLNNIIRSKDKKKNIYMIDFDKKVNQNFGRDDLFLDEIYPNMKFYDLLGQEMAPMITKILKG